MDKRDIALQRSCPTSVVPLFSEFAVSEHIGSRILMASNGVFLEVTRQWGYFRRKVGDLGVTVPYGEIQDVTKLSIPSLPRQLLLDFNQLAIKNANVEIGASIVWNEKTNAYRLLQSTSLASSSDLLHYKMADLEAGDHLIIDCHSHSHHPAFFSGEDDLDDKNCVKFSYVVGNCNLNQVSVAMRLCINGIFEKINAQSIF